MLEHLGLVSALTELSTRSAASPGSASTGTSTPSLPRLAPEIELAVYRIAQESLTNIARHADANRVTSRSSAATRASSSA